jgi:hypothetical protein
MRPLYCAVNVDSVFLLPSCYQRDVSDTLQAVGEAFMMCDDIIVKSF